MSGYLASAIVWFIFACFLFWMATGLKMNGIPTTLFRALGVACASMTVIRVVQALSLDPAESFELTFAILAGLILALCLFGLVDNLLQTRRASNRYTT